MGNVGNKFLPGIVNHLHLRQQLVKGIDNVLRFDIIGNCNGLVRKTVLYLGNRLGHPVEGLDKNGGKSHGHTENTDDHHDLYNQGLPVQDFHCRRYAVRGNTGKHNSNYLALLRLLPRIRLRCLILSGAGGFDGNGHFDITVFLVIPGGALSLETPDDLLGNNRFAFTDTVCIFYYTEIAVNDNNAAVVQIGHLFQLRVNCLI